MFIEETTLLTVKVSRILKCPLQQYSGEYRNPAFKARDISVIYHMPTVPNTMPDSITCIIVYVTGHKQKRLTTVASD